MAKLIWTDKATVSLEKIAEFIAKDSVFYAKKTVLEINKLTKVLKTYPNSGRIVPECNEIFIRELIYKSYRIIYKIDNDSIYILTVISGYKELKNGEL